MDRFEAKAYFYYKRNYITFSRSYCIYIHVCHSNKKKFKKNETLDKGRWLGVSWIFIHTQEQWDCWQENIESLPLVWKCDSCINHCTTYYPGQKNWDRHARQTTGACMLERSRACARWRVAVPIFLARVVVWVPRLSRLSWSQNNSLFWKTDPVKQWLRIDVIDREYYVGGFPET